MLQFIENSYIILSLKFGSNVLKKILSFMRRAIDDYNMIEDGDKIAVGVSGGKDSVALMLGLNALKRFYPKQFDIVAITVSMGFEGTDFSPIKQICDKENIEYVVEDTSIGEIVFNVRKEPNPCSLCSKMRSGALNEAAIRLGCNKVALGHHYDDVVETFLMSLFKEGRINCFSPVTYLDRMKITKIRPFIYIPEKEITYYTNKNNLPIVKNPCPADGNTTRQRIKDLIFSLEKENKGLKQQLFHAIKTSEIKGWKL